MTHKLPGGTDQLIQNTSTKSFIERVILTHHFCTCFLFLFSILIYYDDLLSISIKE